MKKKIFSLVFAFAMALSVFGGMSMTTHAAEPAAPEEPCTGNHDDWIKLTEESLQGLIKTGYGTGQGTITLPEGKYYLDTDILYKNLQYTYTNSNGTTGSTPSMASTLYIGGDVTLCLNGKVLDFTGAESKYIDAGVSSKVSNATINICSCKDTSHDGYLYAKTQAFSTSTFESIWSRTDPTNPEDSSVSNVRSYTLKGGIITGASNIDALIKLSNNNTLNLFSNVNLAGNASKGLITIGYKMSRSPGYLNVCGANLIGNNATSGQGCISIIEGTAVMYDGKITKNSSDGVDVGDADKKFPAKFIMYGGEISENAHWSTSAGIHLVAGYTLEVYGGTISSQQRNGISQNSTSGEGKFILGGNPTITSSSSTYAGIGLSGPNNNVPITLSSDKPLVGATITFKINDFNGKTEMKVFQNATSNVLGNNTITRKTSSSDANYVMIQRDSDVYVTAPKTIYDPCNGGQVTEVDGGGNYVGDPPSNGPYEFAGWYTGLFGSGAELTGTPAVGATYYAKWVDATTKKLVITQPLDFVNNAANLPAKTDVYEYDSKNNILTLDGLTVDATAGDDSSAVVYLPAGATIELTQGSVNTIIGREKTDRFTKSYSYGLNLQGTTTITGAGELHITSGKITFEETNYTVGSYGIQMLGSGMTLTLEGGAKLYAKGGDAVRKLDANETVQNNYVISSGIHLDHNSLVVGDDCVVEATGGNAYYLIGGQEAYTAPAASGTATSSSNGIYEGTYTLNGTGTMTIQAGNAYAGYGASEAIFAFAETATGKFTIMPGSANATERGAVYQSKMSAGQAIATNAVDANGKAQIYLTKTEATLHHAGGNPVEIFLGPELTVNASASRVYYPEKEGEDNFDITVSAKNWKNSAGEDVAVGEVTLVVRDAEGNVLKELGTLTFENGDPEKTFSANITGVPVGNHYVVAMAACPNPDITERLEGTSNLKITQKSYSAQLFPCTVVYPDGASAFTYDGTEKEPKVEITVKAGNQVVATLEEGKDYTLSYENNISAGSNTAKVKVTFIGNYTGSISMKFSIRAKTLTADDISDTLVPYKDGPSENPADGATGTITVKDTGATLTEDTDYSLRYDAVEGGKVNIFITFAGNYSGEVALLAREVKTKLSDDMFNLTSIGNTAYTGSDIEFAIEPAEGAGITDDDYTVEYTNNKNVGTATVTITGQGNCTGTVIRTFEITPKAISDESGVEIKNGPFNYTGSQITPEIIVKDGETTLTKAENADAPGDYYVTYGENINVEYGGEGNVVNGGTITIHFKGNYSGDVTKDFVINPVVLVENNKFVNGVVYDLAFVGETFESTITFNGATLTEGTDYTVDSSDADAKTASITFMGNYSGTYAASDVPVKISIQNCQNWFTVDEEEKKKTYNGSVQNVTVTLTDSAPEGFGTNDFKIIYKQNGVEVEPKNNGFYYVHAVAVGDKYYGETGMITYMNILLRTVDIKVKDLAVTAGAGLPEFELVLIDKTTGEEINDDTVNFTETPEFTILDESGDPIPDTDGSLGSIWEVIKSKAGTYTIRCSNWNSVKLGGDGAGNYSLSKSGDHQEATLTIKKAAASKYTITISDGADTTTTVSVKKGQSYTLPECTFTAPEGKQFKAWSVDGVEKNAGDAITVTANMTITAIWEDVSSDESDENPTYTVGGSISEKTAGGDEAAVPNAVVKLVGKDINVQTTTDENGTYSFANIPVGDYNIVISKTDGKTKTELVTVSSSNVELSVVLPAMNVSSVVTVETEENSPVRGTIVGNLDAEAQLIAEQLTNGTTDDIVVEVDMKIDAQVSEAVDEEVKENIDIVASKQSENLTFVEIEIIQTITTNSVPRESNIHETVNLLQIVIPFDTENRDEFAVYRYHEGLAGSIGNVQKITEEPNIYGERIVVGDGELTVYARYFSTYAIGYSETDGDDDGDDDGDETPVIPGGPAHPSNSSNRVNVSCDGKGGIVTVSRGSAAKGATVTITVTPDQGYELKTLTVIDSMGRAIAVTDIGGGKYTFVMPQGQVYINATFSQKDMICSKGTDCPIWPYNDAKTTAWYHDGVHYCIDNGLMNGVSTTLFAPNGTTTRAQIVTILWRLEGEPYANYAMSFTDVAAGQWYTEAVRWAASENIVGGYSATSFGPNDSITREQFAAILWRYCQYKGIDVSVGEETNILSYSDAFDIHSWAMPAMQWACGAGVIGGIADGNSMKLDPTGTATRAQVATMLWRFCTEIMEP